jgi:nucleoside-diphosphate-sugar epimerase
MSPRTALVVGPTGAIGATLVAELNSAGGWSVVGVGRSPAPEGAPWRHLRADLNDPASLRAALADAPAISHVFYAARAPHGEGGVEDVDGNVRMLVNVVEAVEAHAGVALAHVHLVEGTKWYGVHLGPYRTPAREDDPRHMPPNFYYDQEDALARLRAGKGWTWSSCRPNVVCDFAPRRARNLTSIIGAYAAICAELGVPFDFPGTQAGFETLTEVTDGPHLARGIVWMATSPAAADRAFNITNGDAFRWSVMWPFLADLFGVACGRPRDIRLGAWMRDKGPVWDRIVARHGLEPRRLDQMALWEFGDFVFRQDWDVISDLTRLRACGFGGTLASDEMFAGQIARYREARLLPPAAGG